MSKDCQHSVLFSSFGLNQVYFFPIRSTKRMNCVKGCNQSIAAATISPKAIIIPATMTPAAVLFFSSISVLRLKGVIQSKILNPAISTTMPKIL